MTTRMLLVVVLVVTACGPQRSTAAFCETLRTEAAALRDRYGARLDQAGRSDQPLAAVSGLLTGVQALGDFNRMVPKLAEHAPDEIRADMDELARLSREQPKLGGGGAGDILSALATGVMGGLMASGAMERVDEFAQRECGEQVFGLADVGG